MPCGRNRSTVNRCSADNSGSGLNCKGSAGISEDAVHASEAGNDWWSVSNVI